ncbi:hypothetical protein MRX96_042952 [Rhipicephalus microplus]
MRTPTSGSSRQPETQPLDGKSAPVNSDDSAHDDHNEPMQTGARQGTNRMASNTHEYEGGCRQVDGGAKVIQLGPRRSTPFFSGIHNPAPPNTHRSRRTPRKQSIGPKCPPVGLLFQETRSNDVIPQAVQPQQSPPWQGNIPPPYQTQLMGALPIGLDLARMIADMVQHYMRQQRPQ